MHLFNKAVAAISRASSRKTAVPLYVFLFLLISTVAAYAVPAAPSGVWTVPGNNYVAIYWNTVPGATSYSLYRATSPGGEGSVPYQAGLGTSYGNSSLTNGTTYYYQVTAFYGTVESPKSSEVSGIPGSAALLLPLLAATPHSGSAQLNWSAVVGATSYDVFRYDPSYSWQIIQMNVAGTTATDTAVTNGTPYQYLIEASNASGNGANSNVVTCIPGDTPLSPPSGLWAVSYNNTAYIYWNTVPGATSYNVFRSTTHNGEGASPYYVGTGVSYGEGGLTNGTTYYYKVTAVDMSGQSILSSEATVTPGVSRLAGNSLSAAAGLLKVTLNWTPVVGATYYDVFKAVSGDTLQLYKTVTTTTLADTAVANGVTYTYTVYPGNVDSLGNASNAITVKPGNSLLPAPSGIYVNPYNAYNVVYWNPVNGASSYNLYRGTSAGHETLFATGIGSSYGDSNVTNGTTYYYKATAVYQASEGKQSAEASGTPGVARLASPILTGGIVSLKLTLYWTLVTGATSYNIYRSAVNIPGILLKQGIKPAALATFGTYVDATAVKGVIYTYVVQAVNKDGSGNSSNSVTVNAGGLTIAAPLATIAFSYNAYVTVYCTPVPGAAYYYIYRSTVSGGEGSAPLAVTSSGYGDSNVVNGTTYYYKFTAYDVDGQSLPSPEVSCTPGIAALPAPILTASATSTSVILNWSSVTGAASYDIYRAPAGGSYSLIKQSLVGSTFTDSGLTVGVNYSYYIYPVSVNGAGSRSGIASATPGSTPISPPSAIYATAYNAYITIYWNSVLGAASYNLYRSTTSNGEGAVPIAVGIGAGYGDSAVTNGTIYYYKATAVTADGESLQSVECSANPGSAYLTAPTLSVSAGASSLNLTWNTITGATGYNVYRYISGGGWIVIKQNASGTSFSDNTVLLGATYGYAVYPVNVNGQGSSSNQVTSHT